MKKLMALFLCLCMAVSLAAPAFAAEADTAALVADVLAAVSTEETETAEAETGDEAGVLLTEENAESEPVRDREDFVDEGGDESGSENEDTTPPATEGALTDTIFWTVIEDGDLYILLISGTGAMPDYNAIGETPWFPFMDTIVAVIIADGITHIGDNSFAHLQSVSSVSLPKGLESIGESAFRANTALKSIELPASLKTIDRFAFSQAGLKSVTLPKGLQTLGDSAFNPCNSLTEVTLPGGITSLGDGAFGVCESLKTITVGEGITHLPDCFVNCSAAETLNLPSTIKTMDHNFIVGLGEYAALKTITVADKADGTAFRAWKDEAGKTLTNDQLVSGESFTGMLIALWGEAVSGSTGSGTIEGTTISWVLDEDGVLTLSGEGHIPNYDEENLPPWNDLKESITTIVIDSGNERLNIGTNAFAGCVNLTVITIESDNLRSIGAGAFAGCTGLTALELPATTRIIGAKAFAGCTGLTMLTLPKNLTSLAEDAFDGCDALHTVRTSATEFRWKYLNELPATINGVTISFEPPVSLNSGKCGDNLSWKVTSSATLTDVLLTISGTGAMADYEADGSYTAPWNRPMYAILEEGVTTIGDYAFYKIPVQEIWLPEGLTSIGEGAFEGSSLLAIDLPSTIETLGPDCFKDCDDLESITVADKADGTTFRCWKDEAGKTLTNDQLLAGESYTGSLTALWSSTISGKLTDTILWEISDEGVLSITGTGAMPDDEYPWSEYREEITSIEVGEGITAIGNSSFTGCEKAVTVSIPSTVTAIGDDAFAWCAKLESATLPLGLETLGEGAFRDCWALTEITIPGSVKTIGTSTFLNCESLKTITVEEGVTELPAHFACDCTAAETLSLPSTIKTLGMDCLPENLKTVTVAETGGRKFLGWEDVDGNLLSNDDLLTLKGHDVLTAQWYGFTDVEEGHWFYDYVMFCYDNDLMYGVDDGSRFDPYGGATRAQVLTVLYRLMEEPAVTSSTSFSDVPANTWYTDAVAWADANGIAKGYGDGTFRPNAPVTREEFLVFLHRFTVNCIWDAQINEWSALYDLEELDIRDAGDISSWALEAETWSTVVGLQAGYDNGDGTYSLNPRNTISRAELATFLARYTANIVLYTYAEIAQMLVGYETDVVTAALETQPDDILPVDDYDGLEIWCYYDLGIALLVDYSESSKGIVLDWLYT